ncbi:MAG: acetylxylan esterase [Victivallales bacterium]|nr:acetylxylan esterase [Victivallales bacterium]
MAEEPISTLRVSRIVSAGAEDGAAKWLTIYCLIAGIVGLSFLCHADESFFLVPDFKELPPDIEVMSEETDSGVKVTELYFAGAPFNGKPTRIYGFYCRPEKEGIYPGVVQLHGAGLKVLSPDAAVFYAKNGFACISIDWCGPASERKEPRKPPCSEFISPGNLARRLPEGEKEKAPPHGWKSYGVEVDGITNGVRFVRRAFMFLRSRQEVDSGKLCLSGMSAGAHLSLLTLGFEPGLKAAAVKYGCGFIRDMPGFFGGYFGPIAMTSKEDQDAWLALLDPKHYMQDYKSSVLMLSGTDDIFFWMPIVLHTYRAIPTPKRLIMLPNDNHSQVLNEEIPLRYFKSVLGTAPAFPEITALDAQNDGDKVLLTMKVNAPSKLTRVEYAFKTMPVKTFWFGRNQDDPNRSATWAVQPATEKDGGWVLSVPAPKDGEQMVAYGLVEDETGAKSASDTVEIPEYPKWRGLKPAAISTPENSARPADVKAPAEGENLIEDPSFEEHKMNFNFVNGPHWDDAKDNAHSGTTSVIVLGGDKQYLAAGRPVTGGKKYSLVVHYRAVRDGLKGRMQINWSRQDGSFIKYDMINPSLLTEYGKFEMLVTAPADAAKALLILGSGSAPEDNIWMDDLFFGVVK